MKKMYCLIILIYFSILGNTQSVKFQDSIRKDSTYIEFVNLDEVAINDDHNVSDNAPSLLTSSRNPILNFAYFKGGSYGFKLRALSVKYSAFLLNGIDFKNVEKDRIPFEYFNGLNGIFTNQIVIKDYEYNENCFGNVGFFNINETKPSLQNKGFKISYQNSNRSFQQNFNVMYSTGRMSNNWAFTLNLGYKTANKGSILNGYVQANSFFISIEKITHFSNSINLTLFYVPSETSKRAPATKEAMDLTNNPYYNPGWGFNNGDLMFSTKVVTKQPVAILNYKLNFHHQSFISSSISYSQGETMQYGLDWQNANDPRPDYYKYLPSYQTDSLLKIKVAENFRSNTSVQFINWSNLYNINKTNQQTIQLVNGGTESKSGAFSHYILKNEHSKNTYFQWNNFGQFLLGDIGNMTMGLRYKQESYEHYSTVEDLLGGDYFVNWNYYSNSKLGGSISQYDLKNPNKIVYLNGEYGPHYIFNFSEWMTYWQSFFRFLKFEWIIGAQYFLKNYNRVGLNQNGLFPNNSFGASPYISKNEYNLKVGLNYHVGNRLYIQLSSNLSNNNFDINDSYYDISMQNNQIGGLQEEQYFSNSLLITFKSSPLKFNINPFLNFVRNEHNIYSFFHDAHFQFVDGVIYNINKQFYGIETNLEYTINEKWKLGLVGIWGNYTYTNNPNYNLFLSNDNFKQESGIIYIKNFPVTGTAQSAGSFSVNYNNEYKFSANLTYNIFGENYTSINFFRRSNIVLHGLDKSSKTFQEITQPVLLPFAQSIDLNVGASIRFKIKNIYKNLRIYLILNNLLNNTDNVTLGYEQLRFDYANKNIYKFNPKYLNAPGINFTLSTSINF